jgi:catechol 2,3-dioxygenase-like lactoylglutathione lyase family enzyme
VRIVDARFPAADPVALAAWYDEHLGATPTFAHGEATPHHFAFHVADLEPWKERLETTEEHDFSTWGGARAVYFRDPEANVGELIARPRPRTELTLAEVGLPVDEVPAAVMTLQRELGLEPYGDPSDDFAPVGDDDGLLIVVRVGRGWFPVGVPAGDSAIEIRIADTTRRGEARIGTHRVVAG